MALKKLRHTYFGQLSSVRTLAHSLRATVLTQKELKILRKLLLKNWRKEISSAGFKAALSLVKGP